MEISPPAGKSELLFFEPRPTQVQMIQGSWIDVRPMQSLETSGPLTFRLPASSEMVVDLARTFLYLRCKIVLKDGSTAKRPPPTTDSVQKLRNALTTATASRAIADTELTLARETLVTATATLATATQAYNTEKNDSNKTVRDDAQNAKDTGSLNVTAKITAGTKAKAAEDKAQLAVTVADKASTSNDPDYRVAPVANFLHSLFSSVDLSLNGRSIVSSGGNYAYKSYITTLLSANRDAINSQYESALFYPDDPKVFDTDESIFTKNSGLLKRYNYTYGSQEFEVMDILNIDLANQEKLLIPGVGLILSLRKNDPKFCLMSFEPGMEFRVDITEAILYVRQVEISPSLLIETERRLQTDTAKYYFQRVEVNVLPLSVNSTVINEANLSLASPALPNRIVIGIVETEAHLGSYALNPFKFQLHNLNTINFVFNGQSMPYRMIPYAADKSQWLMGFYSLFSQTGLLNHPMGSSWVSRDNWLNGYALMVFDFTPDGVVGEHLQVSRGGVLNLEMRFSQPLAKNASVIILSSYDSYLQITGDRSIVANYTLG